MSVDGINYGVGGGESADNSTSTALSGDATYTGATELVSEYSSTTVTLYATPPSAGGTLNLDYSTDGTNWDRVSSFPIVNPTVVPTISIAPSAKYFRVRYVNDSVAQTAFRLQTLHHTTKPSGAVMSGQDNGGHVRPILTSTDGSMRVAFPETAFGELLIAELTPSVQLQWPYGIITRLVDTVEHGTGTVTHSNSEVIVSSGATSSSIAWMYSKDMSTYEPGEGTEIRFAGRFSAPTAGATQLIGPIDPENGLAFGYNGTAFGVLRRSGGQLETRTLTVSAGAVTTAGDVTVVLNGGSGVAVSLSSGDSIAAVVRKIAAADFSDEGGGWTTVDAGDTVVFKAISTEARGGAYSFTDTDTTGADGGIAQTLAAVAPTDTWVAQTAWNGDKAAGAGLLPSIDHTKGNVFRIQYQWLGYGLISFAVEDPVTSRFVPVHKISYANDNTEPSLINPAAPLSCFVDNGATAANVSARVSSMAAFTQGRVKFFGARNSINHTKSIDSTETAILSIRNNSNFLSKTNKVRTKLEFISLSNDSTSKSAVFKIVKNAGLVGAPSWTAADSGSSVMSYDTTATDVSGGQVLFTYIIASGDSQTKQLTSVDIDLLPGDKITVLAALISGSASDLTASLNWVEDF